MGPDLCPSLWSHPRHPLPIEGDVPSGLPGRGGTRLDLKEQGWGRGRGGTRVQAWFSGTP